MGNQLPSDFQVQMYVRSDLPMPGEFDATCASVAPEEPENADAIGRYERTLDKAKDPKDSPGESAVEFSVSQEMERLQDDLAAMEQLRTEGQVESIVAKWHAAHFADSVTMSATELASLQEVTFDIRNLRDAEQDRIRLNARFRRMGTDPQARTGEWRDGACPLR